MIRIGSNGDQMEEVFQKQILWDLIFHRIYSVACKAKAYSNSPIKGIISMILRRMALWK